MTTKIEWTDETWNPITGCTPISEGCQNCYAKRMADRLRGRYGYPEDDPFRVTYHPDKLDNPLEWKKPRMVFVCSMGDLFHEDVEFITIARIFFNALRTKHTYLFLTKRPERMKGFIEWYEKHQVWGGNLDLTRFKNIWLGVTAENQKRYEERWLIAQEIPAAKLFISFEPLLSPIKFMNGLLPDWVICGAETGPGARPMNPEWAIDLYEQSKRVGVPYFFKKESKGMPVPDYIKVRQYPD